MQNSIAKHQEAIGEPHGGVGGRIVGDGGVRDTMRTGSQKVGVNLLERGGRGN